MGHEWNVRSKEGKGMLILSIGCSMSWCGNMGRIHKVESEVGAVYGVGLKNKICCTHCPMKLASRDCGSEKNPQKTQTFLTLQWRKHTPKEG